MEDGKVTESELPKQTAMYRLPAEIYDQFYADLETTGRDLSKLEKLFKKPTPFIQDCE